MKRTVFVLAAVILPLVAFAGCLPYNFPNSSGAAVGDLGLQVWVNTTRAEVGTPIQIRYTVTNYGDEPSVIELVDRSVMDILISFESSQTHERTVIRWSDGREITKELRRLVWEPGETKTLEMTWVVPELADNTTVDVGGALRFGEREEDTQGTGVSICVERCRPE